MDRILKLLKILYYIMRHSDQMALNMLPRRAEELLEYNDVYDVTRLKGLWGM